MTQAICTYRKQQDITGPLFLGFDTHALYAPAFASALEVLAGNEVEVMIAKGDEYTPTPALSHAILSYNRGRTSALADGIVITPSHNPPDSGGFKYNPPNGGPADTQITGWVQDEANRLIAANLIGVRRVTLASARTA
jgi:phosphoglucomutase